MRVCLFLYLSSVCLLTAYEYYTYISILNIVTDVLICSAVLTSDLSVSTSKDVHKKLVILLDSGRIHFIDLFVGSDGVLEEEGEPMMYFDLL